MKKSCCSSYGSLRRTAAAGMCALLAVPALVAQAPRQGTFAAMRAALVEQADKAEQALQLDVAAERLYELLIEHPDTAEADGARLRLARLLALSGRVEAALLQCQLAQEEAARRTLRREQSADLATILGRRLRAGLTPANSYFPVFEAVMARGVQSLDRPKSMMFDAEGRLLLLDEGARRLYRVGSDAATSLAVPQDPKAIAILPDSSVVVFGKTGLSTVPPSRAVLLKGAWGGKARQAKDVKSMAAVPGGDLLVIDDDYDGVLRCQPGPGTCAPWGPAGKYRSVAVGPTGWVYLLDDRGQSVRVVDGAMRQLAVVGPSIGSVRIDKVEDIAVDQAEGLFLLDTDLKRLHVVHMRSAPGGKLAAVLAASQAIPQDGPQALKNLAAIAVAPDGAVLVAGRSSARIMRLR